MRKRRPNVDTGVLQRPLQAFYARLDALNPGDVEVPLPPPEVFTPRTDLRQQACTLAEYVTHGLVQATLKLYGYNTAYAALRALPPVTNAASASRVLTALDAVFRYHRQAPGALPVPDFATLDALTTTVLHVCSDVLQASGRDASPTAYTYTVRAADSSARALQFALELGVQDVNGVGIWSATERMLAEI